MKLQFKCKQCGRCCRKYGEAVKATREDMERWKKEGREDILEYVYNYELCFDPRTGERMGKCPFFRKKGSKFVCAIHKTKPEACREYPLLVNARTLQDRVKECRGMKLVKETKDDVRFCAYLILTLSF